MTARFDENGDLWISVVAGQVPAGVSIGAYSFTAIGATVGGTIALTEMNLTDYMRKAMQPSWVRAALTPSSADITIVGNTPTTGGQI